MQLHYSDAYSDLTYNDILVSACAEAGIVAMTGDGADASVVPGACAAIQAAGGMGIPTIKPWGDDVLPENSPWCGNPAPLPVPWMLMGLACLS